MSDANKDVLVIKRVELINLLVDAYCTGAETIRDIVDQSFKNHNREQMVAMFEARFGGVGEKH
jgi:hypothetical protein